MRPGQEGRIKVGCINWTSPPGVVRAIAYLVGPDGYAMYEKYGTWAEAMAYADHLRFALARRPDCREAVQS